MIYFTSDLHFFHKNILKYNPKYRMYKNVELMNQGIVTRINHTVEADDTLYILGDLSIGGRQGQVVELFNQIICKDIRVVPGNHDKPGLLKRLESRANVTVLPQLTEITIPKQRAVLCHYPLASWNQQARGSFMLHGHSHGSYQGKGKILDVGWDSIGCPISWDEICYWMDTREIYTEDHH